MKGSSIGVRPSLRLRTDVSVLVPAVFNGDVSSSMCAWVPIERLRWMCVGIWCTSPVVCPSIVHKLKVFGTSVYLSKIERTLLAQLDYILWSFPRKKTILRTNFVPMWFAPYVCWPVRAACAVSNDGVCVHSTLPHSTNTN